jgi:hypothetical protein
MLTLNRSEETFTLKDIPLRPTVVSFEDHISRKVILPLTTLTMVEFKNSLT